MTEQSTSPRYTRVWVGKCAKHGTMQVGVRDSDGLGPSLPLKERFRGEFCIRCYLEAQETRS